MALDTPVIKAIIFDCFGVLAVNVHELYYTRFTQQQAMEFQDLNQMRDHGFLTQEEYFKAVSQLAGEPIEVVRQHFLKEFHLNTELVEFIRNELKPRYKIGLLSNMGRDWAQDLLGSVLEELFAVVVLSGEEGITKPNPLIYERTVERLGVQASECVMVDDAERNCRAASNLGMQTILYTSSSQTIKELKNQLG